VPRYFFHVWDGEQLTQDERGLELNGLYEAIREAFIAIEELASDELTNHVLHVADEIGILLGIPFTAPQPPPRWLH
jgi:hypothetical protein